MTSALFSTNQIKSNQGTILTGSSDGLIRLCTVQPNKLLGVLGSHDDFPVEGMKVRFKSACTLARPFLCPQAATTS